MKKYISLSVFLFMSHIIFCTEEKTLFEGNMISAVVWVNPNGEFCLMYHSKIIIIDQWYYAEIDD